MCYLVIWDAWLFCFGSVCPVLGLDIACMGYSESEMPSSPKDGHQRHEKKQRLMHTAKCQGAGASLGWHGLLEGRG